MEALKGPVLVEVDVSKLMGSESFSGGARKLERSSVAIPPSIDKISGSVRRKELALWSKMPQNEFAGHQSRHHVEDASEDHTVGKTNTILPLTLGLEATQLNRNFGKVGRNNTSNSKRSRIMQMDVSVNKTSEDGKGISTEISTNPTNCKNGDVVVVLPMDSLPIFLGSALLINWLRYVADCIYLAYRNVWTTITETALLV